MMILNGLLDPVKRFLGHYDSNGLKYSLRHLNEIRFNIQNYPLNLMAEYADKETIDNCMNKTWIAFQFQYIDPDNSYQIENANTTIMGNMAYIFLHSNDEAVRNKCIKFINARRDYVERTKSHHI